MASQRLLVLSGAGLPAWIWDEALDGVAERRVVDFGRLTGPGGSLAPGSSRAGSGGERLVDYAREALDQAPWDTFTVVAHSVGGVVAAELCHLAPDRVDGVVAVSAVIPTQGSSFVAAMPVPQRFVLPLVLRLAGTRPPEAAVRKGLASHVDEDVAGRLVAEFRPESRGLFRDRVDGPVRFPDRRSYLLTTDDREIPPGLQARFARNLGVTTPVSLDGGHLPMVERPGELRAALEAFLQG